MYKRKKNSKFKTTRIYFLYYKYLRNNASVYDLLQSMEVSVINTWLMSCKFTERGSFFNEMIGDEPVDFFNYLQ